MQVIAVPPYTQPMDISFSAEQELPHDIILDDGVIHYKVLENGSN